MRAMIVPGRRPSAPRVHHAWLGPDLERAVDFETAIRDDHLAFLEPFVNEIVVLQVGFCALDIGSCAEALSDLERNDGG